jgi:RHS repeat-associated protein
MHPGRKPCRPYRVVGPTNRRDDYCGQGLLVLLARQKNTPGRVWQRVLFNCPYGHRTNQTYIAAKHPKHFSVKENLSSTRAVVDEAGDVVEAYDYYPFGLQSRSYKEKGNPLTKVTFTGKEQDIESNLHYFGARYYDAGAGRWLSVDPLADSYYAWSAYNCSMNDPFNKYDPDGQFVATISGLAIGAIAGGINAYMNNESIASGMTEGAIAGGIAGAVIDATVATGGGAAVLIAGAAIGGGFGAGVGDVAGQTMKQVQQGTNISDVKINTSQTMSKAVTGFVTGAVSGAAGAVVSKGLSAITNTTKGVQAAGSKMLESTSKSLMKSGASQSTINCVQNKIVSGMQLAGKNTAESALKIRAAATAAIDAAAQGSQINKTKDEDKKE